jgi:hypothetical protein
MSTCGVGMCSVSPPFLFFFFFSCVAVSAVVRRFCRRLSGFKIYICLFMPCLTLYTAIWFIYVVGVPLFLSVYRSGVKCKVGVFAVGKFLYVCVCVPDDRVSNWAWVYGDLGACWSASRPAVRLRNRFG